MGAPQARSSTTLPRVAPISSTAAHLSTGLDHGPTPIRTKRRVRYLVSALRDRTPTPALPSHPFPNMLRIVSDLRSVGRSTRIKRGSLVPVIGIGSGLLDH